MRILSQAEEGGARPGLTRGRLPWLVVPLAALAFVAASACGGDGDAPAPKARHGQRGDLRIVATTAPVAALAREVAGDRAQVRAVMPPGADPHQFEPTASDLTAISEADLILRHDIGLDEFLDGAIAGAGGGLVVTVTEGIPLQPGAVGGGSSADPHVWLDPTLAQQMVNNIRDALIQVDPSGREAYETNADAYNSLLAEVDRQVLALIDGVPAENRKMVTNHDGFGYFARRYGLEIVGAVTPSLSTEGEPSAREVAGLLGSIEREGVRAIFIEKGTSADLARQLARDAGVAAVEGLYVDSLGGPGSGADTVHDMLLADALLIAEALR